MTMLGTTSFKRAIEEAEKLSESLKLRLNTFVVLDYTQSLKSVGKMMSEHKYVINLFLFYSTNRVIFIL